MQQRDSMSYQRWRNAVFKRDQGCVLCKRKIGKFEAHHIESYAENPEKRFLIGNGCQLCFDCHNKTKGHEIELVEQFKQLIKKPFKFRNIGLR